MAEKHQRAVKSPHYIIALVASLATLACANGPAGGSQASNNMDVPRLATQPSIALNGRVTDAAQLLSSATITRLSAKLANLESMTKHQVVIVTVTSLGGRDIEDFTRDLSNTWGIGRNGYNDGVVLLVAPNERKVRIAVGYGLESVLTKGVCNEIIQTSILPKFRAGDFSGGIEDGSDALIAKLTG